MVPWVSFSIFVLAMLALDLGVFHRKAHEVKVKEALVWSAVWIALALLFNLGIYFWRGPVKALEFLNRVSHREVAECRQHLRLIVYTSNVFAILGLRALYFALAGMMQLFHYLHYGLSAILVFVGIKMLLADIYKIPVGIALGVIASVLLVSVIVSVIQPRKVQVVPALGDDEEKTATTLNVAHRGEASS